MKASLDQQLAALPTLPREELRRLWQEEFDRPLYRRMRHEIVTRILAYRLQERAFGGLKASTANQLRELVNGGQSQPKSSRAKLPRPNPGTRIVREWRGRLHEISVLSDGYQYEGRKYRSLSAIARAITGTRWSGPAFFGMKRGVRKAEA
jgi:hypothetical protein